MRFFYKIRINLPNYKQSLPYREHRSRETISRMNARDFSLTAVRINCIFIIFYYYTELAEPLLWYILNLTILWIDAYVEKYIKLESRSNYSRHWRRRTGRVMF